MNGRSKKVKSVMKTRKAMSSGSQDGAQSNNGSAKGNSDGAQAGAGANGGQNMRKASMNRSGNMKQHSTEAQQKTEQRNGKREAQVKQALRKAKSDAPMTLAQIEEAAKEGSAKLAEAGWDSVVLACMAAGCIVAGTSTAEQLLRQAVQRAKEADEGRRVLFGTQDLSGAPSPATTQRITATCELIIAKACKLQQLAKEELLNVANEYARPYVRTIEQGMYDLSRSQVKTRSEVIPGRRQKGKAA